jgi:subfamily B ATP-binding cassette protein HlyB/CyaB
MAMEAASIEPGHALWLLSSFCLLHQRSFDSEAVARECIPPLLTSDLERLGNKLGLSIDCRRTPADLSTMQLPAAVQLRIVDCVEHGDSTMRAAQADSASATTALEWVILLQADQTGAMIARLGAQTPESIPLADLSIRLTGISLRCTAAAAEAADPDASADSRRTFGFGWFVPELLKHKAIWHEVLLASLVLQLMALAFPLFTQAIIDKVVVHRTQSTLIALAIGMAVFIVFTSSLTWVRQYLILHTGNRVDAVLGSHVFEHLFKLPPLYFQHRPTGVIAARLQGIETIREFVSSAAVTLMLDLPFLLIFVAIMFWYSAQLTWIVLGILALIIAASALVGPLFRQRLNEQFLRGAANQAFVTEYVSGLETVKSLQLEPQLNRRYRDLLAAFLSASFRTKQVGNSYSTLANGLEQLMSLLILTFGAYLVMTSASFTVGMLVAFQMFASRLSQPMLRLVGLWQQFQQARISIIRLGDVMNAPAEPYRLTRARAQAGKGAVHIEGLSFRYEDNLPYLYDGFNLSVAPGQLIAIMGPSGAGKSTLAKLLLGFFQPSQGIIRIDGVDIRHLSANELRSNFGVVPQETTLFSGTILDNLRIANLFASFEQVVAACKMAEIHSSIESLPNGYETAIGERGAGLSGGQRQRIAIARALIKGPKILIFDEATSSVDGSTAEQLGRTINALKGRATILFIAHMLPKTLQVDHTVRIGEKLSVVPAPRAAADGQGGDKKRADTTVMAAVEGTDP